MGINLFFVSAVLEALGNVKYPWYPSQVECSSLVENSFFLVREA